MLKKFLAGLTAVALSLGMIALTAAPASAAPADDCQRWERDNAGLTWEWTNPVVLTYKGVVVTKHANSNNNLTVSGVTPSKITIFNNGTTWDRTGQTQISTQEESTVMWLEVCVAGAQTPPPPPVPEPDPTPYVLVAWSMPGWVNSTTPTWPQTLFTTLDLATKDLNALDAQLTACGTQYQVDLYKDSAKTTKVIQHGVLNGSSNPFPEDFPEPSGWGKTYKLIKNADCQTTPAEATFQDAQCEAGSPGDASYTIPSTTGVQYQVRLNGVGGFVDASADTYYVPVGTTVEVKAVALAGHTLIGTTSWSKTFDEPDCRVTPATPKFNSALCSESEAGKVGKASIELTPTEGVKYEVSINWGSYTEKSGTVEVPAGAYVRVRAVPLDGYTLTGQTEWSKNFKVPDCLTDVTATAPTKTQAVCTGEEEVGPATYTIPEIEGVKYQQLLKDLTWVDRAPGTYNTVDGSVVVLRAVPLPGYELTNPDLFSSTRIYTLLFHNLKASEDCIVPQAPQFDPQVCVEESGPTQAQFTVPSDTGVKYQIWNGTEWEPIAADVYDVDAFPTDVTIRAVPKPGYHFFAEAVTEWSFTFVAVEDCIQLPEHGTVTPLVTFVQTTCSVAGSYTLAVEPVEEAGAITWTVSGDNPNTLGKHNVNTPGKVTIVATAAEGYGIGDGVETEDNFREYSFTFTGLPEDCLPTLALTGAGNATGGLALAGLLALGGMLLIGSQRRAGRTAE